MRAFGSVVLCAWCIKVAGAVVLLAVYACGSPAVDAASYEAQQLACIEEAGTRAQADACRDEVKRRFGRLDGGAQ